MVNHERVEDAFEEAAGGRRSRIRGAGRRRRGRGRRQADDGAACRARTRDRRRAPRPELHGRLRAGRAGRLERASRGNDGAGPRRRALPVRLDRRRVPLPRRPDRAALRRVVGCRGGDGCRRLPRVLRERIGKRERSGSFSRPCDGRMRSSMRCAAARRPTSPSCVSRSDARRRQRGQRSPTPAPSSARIARSRQCFVAIPRSRSTTSTSSSRRSRSSDDSRRPRGPRVAGISESGGECALLADRAEAAGIPFEPLSADLAARLTGAFPNYLTPGNPLDAWGIADETEVYPRSLELLAASGEFDILLAQADLSQFRDRTNDEWCELTLRTLARLADERRRALLRDDDGAQRRSTTALPGARAGARHRSPARAT